MCLLANFLFHFLSFQWPSHAAGNQFCRFYLAFSLGFGIKPAQWSGFELRQHSQGLWWVSERPWNTCGWIVKCGIVTVSVSHLKSLCNEKPHVKGKKKVLYIFVAVGWMWLKPSGSRCFSSRVQQLFYSPSHVKDSYCFGSKEVKHSLREVIADYLSNNCN